MAHGVGTLPIPECKHCGAKMLRWAWYEARNEPVQWWYCLECDKAGREPSIQVLSNPYYKERMKNEGSKHFPKDEIA